MISSKYRFPVIFIGIFAAAILAALYFATIGRMERADAAESIKLYCDAFVRQDETEHIPMSFRLISGLK